METLSLAQYVMINWTYGESLGKTDRARYKIRFRNVVPPPVNLKRGNKSVIFINFTFDRTLGFYFLQIYIPLTIIVMSSWVSFWLVKTNQVLMRLSVLKASRHH